MTPTGVRVPHRALALLTITPFSAQWFCGRPVTYTHSTCTIKFGAHLSTEMTLRHIIVFRFRPKKVCATDFKIHELAIYVFPAGILHQLEIKFRTIIIIRANSLCPLGDSIDRIMNPHKSLTK